MFDTPEGRRVLSLLAELLDYPRVGLAAQAEECERLILRFAPEATERMETFRAFVEATPPAKLEEVFSGFFDLNPLCHPYVGYHLFGETYKRSVFLLGLKERYREVGFDIDAAELPDRLSVVLRFLACCRDAALRDELIDEAVLPSLERMSAADRASQPPAGAHACAPELEGHSHGDVLEGGFLLRLIDPDRGEGDTHPYWRALEAARLVLSSARGERPARATA